MIKGYNLTASHIIQLPCSSYSYQVGLAIDQIRLLISVKDQTSLKVASYTGGLCITYLRSCCCNLYTPVGPRENHWHPVFLGISLIAHMIIPYFKLACALSAFYNYQCISDHRQVCSYWHVKLNRTGKTFTSLS